MQTTIKTTITFPKTEFQSIEKMRKQFHKSRSEIFLLAFRSWMKEQQKNALDDQYAAGYQQTPEKLSDVSAFAKAGLNLWPREKW